MSLSPLCVYMEFLSPGPDLPTGSTNNTAFAVEPGCQQGFSVRGHAAGATGLVQAWAAALLRHSPRGDKMETGSHCHAGRIDCFC